MYNEAPIALLINQVRSLVIKIKRKKAARDRNCHGNGKKNYIGIEIINKFGIDKVTEIIKLYYINGNTVKKISMYNISNISRQKLRILIIFPLLIYHTKMRTT